MRQILAHQLAQLARHYGGTQQRDIARERSLDDSLAQSAQRMRDLVADPGPTPSAAAMQQERQLQLSEVLNRLPREYRLVIVMRNLQELSHAEIAQRLGRSEGAVRVLWLRALQRLKKEMPPTRRSSLLPRGEGGRRPDEGLRMADPTRQFRALTLTEGEGTNTDSNSPVTNLTKPTTC